MREMDLIPEDYRRIQETKKQLTGFGVLYAILILVLVVGKFYLNTKISKVTDQIKVVEQQQESLNQRKKVITTLEKDRSAVEKQLTFVELLQQGGSAEKTFLVFDKVLNKTVWMDEWHYLAADLDVDQAKSMTIRIRGKALDHASLSGFVERLSSQPEITDVIVNNSAMTNKLDNIVTFDMSIK